jgi:dTDP-4-amino-4,6-dideoxygalactose transaminase
MLSIKLKHLSEWTQKRREAAKRYTELLVSADDLITPFEPQWAQAVWHLYVVRVKNRNQVQRQLTEQGIHTGLHYPVPLHLQKAYTHLGYQKGDFPVAEKVAEEILSLPMFPGISAEQQERVINSISDCVH